MVLSEAFAEAHGLVPGDSFHALLGGVRRRVDVVGTALSPEFVYAIGPGALIPDDRRFGVLWMGREALSAVYDLEGAFNEVSVSLERGARSEAVIDALDALLAPYGGVGAYDRSDQISNWFLQSEIEQQANMATIMPTIFLLVAAFLTSTVMSRLIAVERPEIGLLKAFGYSSAAVGWHYAKLVLGIGAVGAILGLVLGDVFGRWMAGIFNAYYRLPYFVFRPGAQVYVLATAVSLGFALLGAFGALRRAVAMPPAEAMRPPTPPLYRGSRVADPVVRRVDPATRMVLRTIARWPGRSALTVLGISMGVALLVTAFQWTDSAEAMVASYFVDAQHQDLSVVLDEVRESHVIASLEELPGVLHAEPARSVAARLRHGVRRHRESIQGVRADARLAPPYDVRGEALGVPAGGLLISTKLAELLDVEVGEDVWVEVLEGRRPERPARVAGVFETYLGTPVYMEIGALDRWMRERPSVNVAHLRVDPRQRSALFRELKEVPAVAGVTIRDAALRRFRETMDETTMVFVGFFAFFSCLLAFGVAYNSTRIALSERGRELATLRVLGMSPLEVSYILLGEVGLLVLLGLPTGCLFGLGLAWLIADLFETELYRLPVVIEPSTFGIAMLVTLAAAAVSALLVRRRLERLDLIAVLKTRE